MYKNVIFIITCLILSAACKTYNEYIENKDVNSYINDSKIDQNLANIQNNDFKKELQIFPETSNTNESKNFTEFVLPKFLKTFYSYNDKAIDILKTAFNFNNNEEERTNDHSKDMETELTSKSSTKTIEETTQTIITNLSETSKPITITETTTSSTTTESASDEIYLSELTNLSFDLGNEDIELGQKILSEKSPQDSDTISKNSIGTEILKNVSGACGSHLERRISFADPTTLMELPWTVLLLYNTKTRYHCGGSLITTKYVLTAAHCVADKFFELTGVRLGEYDVTTDPDCAPDLVGSPICAKTIDVAVVKIVVHHKYSAVSFKNDIALLRLDKDYSERSFYPICLPNPESTLNYNKQYIVAGWGATQNAVRSNILLKANVPILDMSKCRQVYRYNKFNDTTEICGSGTNEIDVCKGDSGGGLIYQETVDGRQKYFQLGIISLGVRRCGDKRFFPAVFTKISGFYKWIENNLEA